MEKKKQSNWCSSSCITAGGLAQVGRALDRRAGDRGLDSWGRNITQCPKITEK